MGRIEIHSDLVLPFFPKGLGPFLQARRNNFYMKHRKKKKGDIHNNIFTTPTFKEGSHGKKLNQYNENPT